MHAELGACMHACMYVRVACERVPAAHMACDSHPTTCLTVFYNISSEAAPVLATGAMDYHMCLD